MVERSEFIQTHLDRVSRSFAFCIRQLPEPLRQWVGISYLLCRIIDTIEDSEFETQDLRIQAFDWFDSSLSNLSASSLAFEYPSHLMPKEVTLGERLLLEDSQTVFEIFWSTDESVRKVMAELALSMSKGMKHFSLRAPGPLRLHNLKEVNQYCFFVAGLVGEMLAHFVSQVEPRFELNLVKLVRAHHFGLFLQKVNLLKDQIKDQKLGRFLVPSRSDLESSAKENAEEAIEFLSEVPVEQMEFRRFCAWSLFLGLETLRAKKLTRKETESILAEVEESLADNGKLKNLFNSFSSRLGWAISGAKLKAGDMEGVGVFAEVQWIKDLYKGGLKPNSFKALGMS